MYPLNDNDLDRLSREAAEQYDVESSTSGWDALENRLNKELPLREEKERRRFLFWLFLIVLLAGGGLLWTMTNRNNDTIQVTHTNGTTPVQNAPQNTNPAADQPSPNAGITPNNAATPATTEAASAPANAVSGYSKKRTGETPVDADDEEFTLVIGEMPAPEKRKTTKRRDQNLTTSKPADASQVLKPAANDLIPDNLQLVTGNRQPVTHNRQPATDNPVPATLHSTIVADIVWDNKLEGIKAPSLNPAVTPAPEKAIEKKKAPQERGFEIAAVVGPDMSNVKFTDMDKAGYNLGLQLGYRFNDHWSVNTGLLYTKKNYTAKGKDFTKPNTNWWRVRELNGVQGYCEMFDIPINIRYDFSVNPKQRWFASAGASTYIMTDEYYNYDVSYNGQPAQYPWSRNSTSSYLFSILNLSAGYERALNKRFAIQAEPYFKFPLKGLGYGKLDLNSYGIYFSLKYKLGK